MAQNRKRAFEGLYSQLEETDGHAVLFSARGEPSVIFEMANPVQQLCTDSEQYLRFQDVLSNLVQTLGEGYALQKQDIFCRQAYHHDVPRDAEFLTRSYFRYFEGREFTEIRTYLIITQEAQRGQFVQYDPKKWAEFHSKVAKAEDILNERHIRHRRLAKEEVDEYCPPLHGLPLPPRPVLHDQLQGFGRIPEGGRPRGALLSAGGHRRDKPALTHQALHAGQRQRLRHRHRPFLVP